jgi:hypothetical protein
VVPSSASGRYSTIFAARDACFAEERMMTEQLVRLCDLGELKRYLIADELRRRTVEKISVSESFLNFVNSFETALFDGDLIKFNHTVTVEAPIENGKLLGVRILPREDD